MKYYLIALLFIPVVGFAQVADSASAAAPSPKVPAKSNVAPKFRFGLKISPTIALMKPDYQVVQGGETFEGNGPGFGFNWGANLEFKMTETVFFSSGLEFNYLPVKHSIRIPSVAVNDTTLQNYDVNYKLRYLDIPLMIRFRTNLIGNMHYYGLFGGTVGFRTGKEISFTTTQSGTTTTTNDDISKYVNPVRGSINVGLGLEFPISGTTSFLGSVVYNNSITNILTNVDLTKSREHAVMHLIQINLGVLF